MAEFLVHKPVLLKFCEQAASALTARDKQHRAFSTLNALVNLFTLIKQTSSLEEFVSGMCLAGPEPQLNVTPFVSGGTDSQPN